MLPKQRRRKYARKYVSNQLTYCSKDGYILVYMDSILCYIAIAASKYTYQESTYQVQAIRHLDEVLSVPPGATASEAYCTRIRPLFVLISH